jgi:hypothetical protein
MPPVFREPGYLSSLDLSRLVIDFLWLARLVFLSSPQSGITVITLRSSIFADIFLCYVVLLNIPCWTIAAMMADQLSHKNRTSGPLITTFLIW